MKKYNNPKEALKRLNVLKQQLALTVLYPEHFLNVLGKEGADTFINDILDEMNIIFKYLRDESRS